jgi:hypothetical protein
VAFFRDLREELQKISVFYTVEEKRYAFRFNQLHQTLQDLKRRSETIDAFDAQRLMFACVHFYRECIRLENFAVMNYQGFSKILKKHDKMTGYCTRTKYMRRRVHLSSFANYPMLLQILEKTEEMFREVEKDAKMNGDMLNTFKKLQLPSHPNVLSETNTSTRPSIPESEVNLNKPKEAEAVDSPLYGSIASSSSASSTCSPVSSVSSISSTSRSGLTPMSNRSASCILANFPASVLWDSDCSNDPANEEQEQEQRPFKRRAVAYE